jgi:hypothetical protein
MQLLSVHLDIEVFGQPSAPFSQNVWGAVLGLQQRWGSLTNMQNMFCWL